MAVAKVAHPSVEERIARGRQARELIPPTEHRSWEPAADRRDPLALLAEQDNDREPDLVPVRHGRMLVSPFTFYRGGAKIMAADLAETPTAGLDVQLCGDAHLSNFGVFASPERLLLFDLNDFDETLPGPFEYDVKRMAASFVIAGRNNGFAERDARAAALSAVTAYRDSMAGFSQMRTMDIWYARLDEKSLMRAVRGRISEEVDLAKGAKGKQAKKAKERAKDAKRAGRTAVKTAAKARTRDSLQALSKLGERVDGRYQIVSQPPIVVPARELAGMYGMSAEQAQQLVHDQFRAYRATLQDDRRKLLERFQIIDIARKVVGVGSVGTRAFIVLLQGRDADDPLFLQVKEATSSVLEGHLRKSRFRHHGERVVQGQRMMQAASDIFLGWTKGAENRHFYWRQLRDMKGSPAIESMTPTGMTFYGGMCGWTLARAHARSGDPVALATYLGDDSDFDDAMVDFAVRYADQNDRDYERFAAAVRSGSTEAVVGV
ncbi:MAG TPA: DUF2252 domain-containing protein [Jatrophihabitans sp.]|nr:DUF2252 domain-containing protein [Jatrophihabitans sp.]